MYMESFVQKICVICETPHQCAYLCARKMRESILFSILCGSFTHLANTLSWTFLINLVFCTLSVTGWVVMSNSRKFCFSVVSTPFSTWLKEIEKFLRWERFFAYQILCKPLPHILELVPQLQWVPSLTRQIFNPSLREYNLTFWSTGSLGDHYLDCFWLVCLLDMLERLIKENISTGIGVLQHDLAAKQVFPSHASPVNQQSEYFTNNV